MAFRLRLGFQGIGPTRRGHFDLAPTCLFEKKRQILMFDHVPGDAVFRQSYSDVR